MLKFIVMRIEIDFDNKTIEVKDSATLGELVDKLKELDLKDWKNYKLKSSIEIISIPQYPQPWVFPVPQPWVQPPYQPWITWGTQTGNPPIELPYTTCSVNN